MLVGGLAVEGLGWPRDPERVLHKVFPITLLNSTIPKLYRYIIMFIKFKVL